PGLSPGLMMPIEVGGPFEMIGIDIQGPFPKSEQGNKYIIVATDYLTKHVEMKAVPAANSWEVSKFLLDEIMCRHGCPQRILSDRGLPFLSNVTKDVYKLMNTKHVKTTSYHPQTNGLVEKCNGIAGGMLSMFVNKEQSNWDRVIKMIAWAYNTSVHETTGFSPFFLLYGREPRLPVNAALNSPSLGISDVETYQSQIRSALNTAHEIARENIKKAQIKYKERGDKKRRAVEYNNGDLVLVYTPRRIKGKAEKLLHPYHGPFKVLRRLSTVVYEVAPVSGRRKPDFVH
ncbi:integrase core domain protein-like protein, partial [Leptotrombidium deliense]